MCLPCVDTVGPQTGRACGLSVGRFGGGDLT